MPFSVPANFIDIFKIGDNINYNLSVLKVLYAAYHNFPDGKKLIKPIIIINTSISEALLYDFIENRIRKANRTETLFSDILAVIQAKKLDKFEHYIEQARKYDFFDLKNTNFYEALHFLRKKRNRIHIQNDKREEPEDEEDVFDEKVLIVSEKILEKILDTMSLKYPRREEYHKYVRDFELPWDRHFKAQEIKSQPTLDETNELGLT